MGDLLRTEGQKTLQVLCFSGFIEVGMSYLGIKSCTLLQTLDYVNVERVYSPWADLENPSQSGIPLWSLENKSLSHTSTFLLSLQYELSFTRIYSNILDLGKIPIRSSQRSGQ